MPKPTATLPEWATTGNYGATVYPPTVISTETTAATAMAAWIAAVSAATAVAAPSDFGEILHPSGGGPTPWSGQPNKEATGISAFANAGFEPAIPIKSENFNEYMNRIYQYANWAKLSTALADLDDHIVQTDATGKAAIAQVNFGGTAFAGSALTATSNASGAAATFADTVGNFAATFAASGSLATARFTNTGTGAAIEALLVGSNGYALSADAGSAGAGAILADGGTSGSGVEAYGGSVTGYGGEFRSLSASPAVYGEGSNNASSEGGQFAATHISATGLLGQTASAATTSANAVLGQALGNGTAVKGVAVDGYGVVAESDTTTPDRAALRVVPQDTDPANQATGDMWFLSDSDGFHVRAVLNAAHYLWTGLRPRMEDEYATDAIHSHSGTDQTAVQTTATVTAKGGDVIVTVMAGVSKTGSTGVVNYKIQSASDSGFTTALVTHENEDLDITSIANGATAAHTRIASQIKYAQGTSYNGVARYWRLVTTPDADTVKVWQSSIRVQGEFV